MSAANGTSRKLFPLTIPVVVLVTVILVLPIGSLVLQSIYPIDPGTGQRTLTFEPILAVFTDSFYRAMLFRTVRVALMATLIALALAYPVTVLMRQLPSKFRGLLVIVMLSPLLMSVVVRTLGWVVMFSPSGLLTSLSFGIGLSPPTILYTEAAISIGLAQVFMGFMVLSLMTSVLKVPDNVLAAASNLGARRWTIWTQIMIPLTKPGIFAGCAIVFPLSASAYVTPALLGGSRNPVMATMIYDSAVYELDFATASGVAVVLLLTTVLVLLLMNAVARRGRWEATR
jgi:putative spermidine/putrescine transport system permease protein